MHRSSFVKELKPEYDAKKAKYDALNANFESSRSSLEAVSDVCVRLVLMKRVSSRMFEVSTKNNMPKKAVSIPYELSYY